MSAERLTRPRHGTIADQMVEVLKASGVRRIHGLPGDSLNGLTDALRRKCYSARFDAGASAERFNPALAANRGGDAGRCLDLAQSDPR